MTPENTENLFNWLKENQPEVIVVDILQEKFGGTKSFDWGIKDNSGTTGSVPGFQHFNTVGESK